MTVLCKNEGGWHRRREGDKEEKRRKKKERRKEKQKEKRERIKKKDRMKERKKEKEQGIIELCILDWSIPAFGGGGPYMHVNSCCILHRGCYLIPNEWEKTDVTLQIMLVLICMLPAECAHSRQGALTTVQLSPPQNCAMHIKHLKHTLPDADKNCKWHRRRGYRLTFSLMTPLSGKK